MKAGASNKKNLLTDWLAVVLACMVLLLFTQREAEFCKTPSCRLIEKFALDGKPNTGKADDRAQGRTVEYKVAEIAVLNSSNPVFQVRNDVRFILNQSVNQCVRFIESFADKIRDAYKNPSFNSFSIPIFHCTLLI